MGGPKDPDLMVAVQNKSSLVRTLPSNCAVCLILWIMFLENSVNTFLKLLIGKHQSITRSLSYYKIKIQKRKELRE